MASPERQRLREMLRQKDELFWMYSQTFSLSSVHSPVILRELNFDLHLVNKEEQFKEEKVRRKNVSKVCCCFILFFNL